VCVEELSAEFCVGRVSDFAQFYPQWQWRHVGLLSERSFWRLLTCLWLNWRTFRLWTMLKPLLNGNNGLLLILTLNNTDLCLTGRCWMFLWLWRSVIVFFSVKINVLHFKIKVIGYFENSVKFTSLISLIKKTCKIEILDLWLVCYKSGRRHRVFGLSVRVCVRRTTWVRTEAFPVWLAVEF